MFSRLFSALAACFLAFVCAFTARAQTSPAANALAVALDAPSLAFTSTGAGAWFSQTAITRDGVDAAQSGPTAAGAKSTLSVTVTGITKFSFRWKVSSESNRDLLTFYINNVAQAAPISGNVDWQTRTYTLSGTGSHTLSWEYAKDATVSSYSDAGWVDQFTILEVSTPTITVQPADLSLTVGDHAALSVQALGGTLSYQWYKGESGVITEPVDGATGPVLLTRPLGATTRYWVKISKGTQTVSSRAAVVTVQPRRTHSLLAAGYTSHGSLGLGDIRQSDTFARAARFAAYASAGADHSLFIQTNGSLWAMGDNSSGQLGDGTNSSRSEPVQIVPSNVAQIATAFDHSLFLKVDRTLWGMGSNAYGQLGKPDFSTNLRSPTEIATAVAQVSAGPRHSLFLKTDGSLLKIGAQGADAASAIPVEVATKVAFVAAGYDHSLFIKTDGSLWTWGRNTYGQLGDGTTEDRNQPVRIADRVVHAAASASHTLFVTADGSLWVMGDNSHGQLGAGASLATVLQPRKIAVGVTRVAAGARHSLFLKTDGSLWAMGDNSDGQLGDGTRTDRYTPVQVAGAIVDLSAGYTHSLLLQVAPSHKVTFVLGDGARRTGGGALVQNVREGEAAVAPTVAAPSGQTFVAWDKDFALVTAPLTITANYLPSQTITFQAPPIVTYSSEPLTLTATSNRGLPVQLTYVSGPATLNGNTLTLSGGGSVVIRATCAAGTVNGIDYAAAAPVQRTIEVRKLPQTLTFAKPASATYGDGPRTLTATTSVPGLAVTLEVKSGPAALDDDVLTFTGAGDVVVSASQTGNGIYAAATPITHTITVAKAKLLVSADDMTRSVGQPNPDFILNYSGFVGGDNATTEGVINTPPTLIAKATATSAPGDYGTTLQGGSSANYTFTLANPAPTLTVVGYGGSYEALLDGDAHELVPVGKLEITVAARGLQYTGTLHLAAESAPITLRGTLVPTPDFSGAAHTFRRAESAALPALELAFTVTTAGEVYGTLERGAAAPVAFADGVRLDAPTNPLGAGAHTLVLGPGLDAEDAAIIPGNGHATATLAPKTAVLSLKGKLADGAPLSATLKPAADRSYRLWVNPYNKRVDSFLAGRLALSAHPESGAGQRFENRLHIPAEPVTALFWQKAALPGSTLPAKRDAAYRAGFGPLTTAVRLDPWLPPVFTKNPETTFTLARRLGIATDNTSSAALTVTHGEDGLDLGALADALPTALTLSPVGRFTVAAPITTPANRAAWRILTLNPATGAFTCRFVLRDPPLAGTREIIRTVDFSGTLRQAPAAETDAPVAEGFFLLPALDASAEKTSHELRFDPAAN